MSLTMLGAALKRIANLENEIAFGDTSDAIGKLQKRAYQRERLRRIDHAGRILRRIVALSTPQNPGDAEAQEGEQ